MHSRRMNVAWGMLRHRTVESRLQIVRPRVTKLRKSSLSDLPRILPRQLLGRGGMGSVWSAYHRELGREVAVKFLLPDHGSSIDAKARLLREGRILGRIESPYVVRVLEACADRGYPYLVLEQIDGRDLASLVLARGALPLRDVKRYVKQIAQALTSCHEAGVIHADVKGQNLLVTHDAQSKEPVVKLIDFGVARSVDEPMIETDHLAAGTPESMSPEQMMTPAVPTVGWDLWGFAVIAYQVLTGAPPFAGNSLVSVLSHAICGNFDPPSRVRSTLGVAVDFVFRRAFHPDVMERYADVEEFADALLAALEPIEAIEESIGAPKLVLLRRNEIGTARTEIATAA